MLDMAGPAYCTRNGLTNLFSMDIKALITVP